MFLRSVAIASALMFSLAGCTGDDSSTTEDTASTTNSTQTTNTTKTTSDTTTTDTTTAGTAGTDSDAMTTTEGTATDTTTTGGTATDPTTGETDTDPGTTTTTTGGIETDTTTTTTGEVADPDCMGEPYCTPGPMGDLCLAEEFGEIAVALQGFEGTVCSPGPCACPMDDAACQQKVDDGDIVLNECPQVEGISGQAQCALTVGVGMGPGSYDTLHCLMLCQLANGNDDCPTGATCEDAMQMGVGICLFPEG